MPRIEMTGQIYGRLTILGPAPNRGRETMWWAQCSCGSAPKRVSGASVRKGKTKSCGCYRREAMLTGRERLHQESRRHGLSDTPEYEAWRGMIRRCTKANEPAWRLYGGRGIKVCDRWLNSFEAFLCDVGRKPLPSMSIDRIDSNGNYEPGNVRWATPLEQVQNTRTYKGGVMNMRRADLINEVQRLRAANSGLLDRVSAAESEGWASYAAECERHAETVARADAAEAKLAALRDGLTELADDLHKLANKAPATRIRFDDIESYVRALLDTPAPTPGHCTCGQPGCSDGGA